MKSSAVADFSGLSGKMMKFWVAKIGHLKMKRHGLGRAFLTVMFLN
jgi:hypothetical protein